MASACRAVLSLLVFPLGLAFAAPAHAALPLVNATCPGGLEVHADEGGPVYVSGREASLKRFSDSYFEARDAQTGTTISITATDGGTQVSYTGKGGANGVCQVAASPSGSASGGRRDDAPIGGSQPGDVTCESKDSRQVSCDMDTAGEVRVVRQLSHTQCTQGETWGLSRHSVWVNGGCRAVFRNVSKASSYAASGDAGLDACNKRQGSAGTLVTSLPVGTDYRELIVQYPEGRYVCMLRNDGSVLSVTRARGQ